MVSHTSTPQSVAWAAVRLYLAATGNIATEDTVYLMESLGIQTGVNREKVGDVTKHVASFLKKTLPGKLYRLS